MTRVMQGSTLPFGAQTDPSALASPAAPPGRCSLDSSVAPCRGPQRRAGSATPGSNTKGESCTGTPWRWHRGGAEVHHHHPDIQPHRHFAQTPKPLSGSASSPADYYCLEQCWGADTPEAMELFGPSSSLCGLQGAGHQSNAQQATTILWNRHWWSVYL